MMNPWNLMQPMKIDETTIHRSVYNIIPKYSNKLLSYVMYNNIVCIFKTEIMTKVVPEPLYFVQLIYF